MERTITVKGVGSVSASPDTIEIMITLSVRDKDYNAAISGANKRYGLLEDALAAVGFKKGALKTVNFSVRPAREYKREKSVLVGYDVVYSLKLEMAMDKELLANTLNAISGCDSNVDFDVKFTVKDKEALKAALLRSVAENAEKNAKILCEASGVALGKLVTISYSWSEMSTYSPTTYVRELKLCDSQCGAPEITPEDIRLNDSAQFVWEIV